jgi:DHA1 family multidrug resistance protein-like MFS transporter
MMAWASTFPLLLLSAIIAALGGGLFDSPKAAAAASLTDASNRRRYYSTMGVVSGIGVAAGTQAGALLIGVDFDSVALVSGLVYFVAFVSMVIVMPPVQVATARHGLFEGIGIALRDKIFVTYALLLMGHWFVATQFNLALVLRATDVANTESAVAWIYWIQSGVIILLGYPLPRLVERRIAALPMLILGIVLIAAGMGTVGLAANVPLLLASVFVVSLGTVLTRPGEQTVSANLADPVARGSYFGVASLSLAVGGGLGNFTGGLIYDFGQNTNRPALPWIVFLLVGLTAAAGLWRSRVVIDRLAAERLAASGDEAPA